MPFRITAQCSDKEAICEDACLFDAIKPESGKSSRRLQIDPELCTDCGACALACPEAAIHYAQVSAISKLYYPSANLGMVSVPASALEATLPARRWRCRTAS